MASVEKRGKYWSVRYVVKDELGNIIGQKRKSGFATKNDAMAAAKDLERATAAGVDVHGDQMTCGEIMEKWFWAKVDTIEKTSLSRYSEDIDTLKTRPVYNTRISALKEGSLKSIISDLVETRHISMQTAKSYTAPLRYALRWAARKGYIARYPFDGDQLPKVQPRPQVIISEEDIADLIAECKKSNPAFLTPLYLALYGGMCREECAGLKWTAVNDKSVTVSEVITATTNNKHLVKQPKTRTRARTITLPQFVMDHLHSLPKVSDYVCVSSWGRPYAVHTLNGALRCIVYRVNNARAAEGKPPMQRPTFHDLRHTHAAMLIAMGIQPKVISERLGHSSIKITMDVYGYLMPGLQEQVADALNDKWAAGQVGK